MRSLDILMIKAIKTLDGNKKAWYYIYRNKRRGKQKMEKIKQHVWETDETELRDLIETGYAEIYADVSLSVIYEELTNCFTDEQINEQFGYYGLCELLHVDGMYYWLMQV